MRFTKFERPVSFSSWLIFVMAAGYSIAAVPTQVLWSTSLFKPLAGQSAYLKSFALFFALAVVLLACRIRNNRRFHWVELIVITAAACGGWALSLLLLKVEVSRPLFVAMLLLTTIALTVSLILPAAAQRRLGIGAAILTALIQLSGPRPHDLLISLMDLGLKPTRTESTITTAFYSVHATFFDNYFNLCDANTKKCETPRTGGALREFKDGFLLATGEGNLHYFKESRDGKRLDTVHLPYDVPINSEAFRRGGGNERDLSVFRVMDILVNERNKNVELYAAHHYWDPSRSCFVMRVSKLESETEAFLAGTSNAQWTRVYDAEPCLPLKLSNGGRKQFGGDGAGGRMILLDENTLLITIGDQQWDGWNWDKAVSQDPKSAYGKILKLDLRTHQATVYSSGHRNPEGLYRAPDGDIWSTEHGPQGGDELNLIVENGNYGWPLTTYGTEYGTLDWPLERPGAADAPEFVRPIYAWVPSVGASDLIAVTSQKFARWRGDLLICTLNHSLYRAHIRDHRVIFMEPINVRSRNGRLRDILEAKDGRLVILLDLGAIAFLDPINMQANGTDPRAIAARGALLFAGCQHCHQVGDGRSHAVGPDLKAIVNRPIASAEGYAYSNALRAIKGNWSEAQLDQFLADPATFAPGTLMQQPGVKDDKDRAALVAHLKTLQ